MNDTHVWPIFVGEIIRAAAYVIAATAVGRLIRTPMASSLGNLRWPFVALLGTIAVLQLVVLAGRAAGCFEVSEIASLAMAILVLAAALLLWPFLGFVGRRLSRQTASKLRWRLRQARAQALRSRRWLELGEELAHVGHWTIEMPDYRVFWSDEVYRIHGLAREGFKLDFDSAFSVLYPEDRSEILAHIARAIVEKSSFDFEARLSRPEGQVRIVLFRGVAKLNHAGELTRLFGILLDVTEQKHTEAQLRALNSAAYGLNEALRQLALMDGLTGLPNRRHFDAAAETEFKRAIRQGTSLGVIMVDIDYFKGYNDLYGHPAGDACLHAVAQAIAGVPRRPGDFAARYGGEEFVILLPNTNATGIDIIANAVSRAVAELCLPHAANPLGYTTVSCGAALFEADRHPHSHEALMQRADQALYEAKRNGRNRVVLDASLAPVEETPPLSSAAGV